VCWQLGQVFVDRGSCIAQKKNKVSQQSLSDDKRVPKKTRATRAPTAVSNFNFVMSRSAAYSFAAGL
jgi:hypothetical protein